MAMMQYRSAVAHRMNDNENRPTLSNRSHSPESSYAFRFLLVDFINHAVAAGAKWEEAVVQAAAARAKPTVLTALAVMLGAFFILDDPIFNGLAVSLIFGILVSMLP